MRRFHFAFFASLLLVGACNGARTPNAANFTKAINAYLTKHGEACAVIGRQFPVDLPGLDQNEPNGIGPKLAALEEAGLLRSSDTTAVVHGMLDPLRGSSPARPVKRYELTDAGKRYFDQISGSLGQTSGFCYGQKRVGSIVKWTEPANSGTSSQTEVTYTYKITNAAAWAQRPDVQQAFSDIRATVTGASKTTEVAGLQLTSKGWEVLGQ